MKCSDSSFRSMPKKRTYFPAVPMLHPKPVLWHGKPIHPDVAFLDWLTPSFFCNESYVSIMWPNLQIQVFILKSGCHFDIGGIPGHIPGIYQVYWYISCILSHFRMIKPTFLAPSCSRFLMKLFNLGFKGKGVTWSHASPVCGGWYRKYSWLYMIILYKQSGKPT